jgi:ubiquinone biosynthesis protein UbiJ
MSPSLLVVSAIEMALNRYLRLDPAALPKVAALSGKVVGLEVLFAPPASALTTGAPVGGLRFTAYLLPGTDTIQVVDSYTGVPDVLIRGTPLAFARQASRGARSTLDSGVEVQGDIHLGKAFQDLLAAVDIDWEEQLSHWVGDAAAHQVGSTLRGFRAWGQQALDTLSQDATEYLQQEIRELPTQSAVADFLDAVDSLRSDTDRLEARIRRLQEAAAQSSPQRT